MYIKTHKSVLMKRRTRSRAQGMHCFLNKAAGRLAAMAMVSGPPDLQTPGFVSIPRQYPWRHIKVSTKQIAQ